MGHASGNRHFLPFALERLLSQWEHRVEYNLSESGVCPLPLRELLIDPAALASAVTPRTTLVAVSNPNNPTGHILTDAEMAQVVAAADRVGAWLLADEVYAGSERLRREVTPSFWGRYDRVIATGGLSKAYGLPGLRIGWVVAPAGLANEIWARQDYTTISTSILSNTLAAVALAPDTRARLIARGRRYIQEGFDLLARWAAEHGRLLTLTPPDAGAIAFVRYALPLDSTELSRRLLAEANVLVAPGDHFGCARHLRLNHGLPAAYVQTGLDRISTLIGSLA